MHKRFHFTDKSNTSVENEGPNLPQESRGNPTGEFDVFGLLRLLLRRRVLIAVSTLAVMIATAGVVLSISNSYRSHASLLPSGGTDKYSKVKELAGLGDGIDGLENSSRLFPFILRSRTIQEPMISKTYTFVHGGENMSLNLSEYLGTSDPDILRAGLNAMTIIEMDKKTGVIDVSVETTYPAFSQALLQEYLIQLEDFNHFKRRSHAGERVAYLARELAQRKKGLGEAEDSLAAYQSRHRNWSVSTDPNILKETSRLQRGVTTRAAAYGFLAQEFEAAKLDVQKDMPIIRVLDNASLPTQKHGPHRALAVQLAGIAAFVGVIVLLCAIEVVRTGSRNRDGHEFDTLRSELAAAFPRSNRLILKCASRVGRPASRAEPRSEKIHSEDLVDV